MTPLNSIDLAAIRADAEQNAVGAAVGDTLRLVAECERLRADNAQFQHMLADITARHFASNIEASKAQRRMDEYLSEGIRLLEQERDALRAELEAIKASGWRNHSVNIKRGEKCPQTLETAQAAWDRDQELIDDQRREIAQLKQTVNDLRQKNSALLASGKEG